jgi:hypothetical protein
VRLDEVGVIDVLNLLVVTFGSARKKRRFMRISAAAILCFSAVTCIAQTQGSTPGLQDGGVHEVLESIIITPIPNAPFTATLATEWVRYAADGATMTFVNERHIARDAQGRIYQERWWLVPKNANVKSRMNWIQISDPKQLTLFNCSPAKKMCDLMSYNPARELASTEPVRGSSGPLSDGKGNVAWEELGRRNIAGIDTVGTRQTTTLNAGVMGNDEPLTSMREFWHSEQFGINLLSIRTGPTLGKQTFTITEFTPGDPDPQLFKVPEGFKVGDQRQNPPISH